MPKLISDEVIVDGKKYTVRAEFCDGSDYTSSWTFHGAFGEKSQTVAQDSLRPQTWEDILAGAADEIACLAASAGGYEIYAEYDDATNAETERYVADVRSGLIEDGEVLAADHAEALELAYETLAAEGWINIRKAHGGYRID